MLAVAGCKSEPPKYPVEGEVVYAGSGDPVPGSFTIWMESTTPPYQRSIGIVKDGKFTMSTNREANGSVAGPQRVRFDPTVPNGGAIDNPEAALARIMHPKNLEFRTSGLTVNIEAVPQNKVRIEVEPPPGGRRK